MNVGGSPPRPTVPRAVERASSKVGRVGKDLLDEIDHALIQELRRNGRASLTALARRLGVSRETIRFRLDRLQRTKVIRQFTVVVDRKAEGQDLVAFTLVNLTSGPLDKNGAGDAIAGIAGVVEVHDVAGRPDFILKIRGTSLAGIGERVNRVREVPGVARTEILACVTTYKEEP